MRSAEQLEGVRKIAPQLLLCQWDSRSLDAGLAMCKEPWLTTELLPPLAHSRWRAQAHQGVGLLDLGVAHSFRDRGASAETGRREALGECQGHVWSELQGGGGVLDGAYVRIHGM